MRDDDGAAGFPFLHRRGPVDLIGLCSAVATPPFVTYGKIGADQIERTRRLLARIGDDARLKVVLIHHPPQNHATRLRRSLLDRQRLHTLLAEVPVDLVLHGHMHRPVRAAIPGRDGPIPVLGAASGSALGQRYAPAHYHMIEFDPTSSTQPLWLSHWQYDPDRRQFIGGHREPLQSTNAPDRRACAIPEQLSSPD